MAPSTKIPKNCPAWLAQWIGKSDERLGNIENCLRRLVKRSASINNNPRPVKETPRAVKETPDKSLVTFKWLVEKLLVPVIFLVAGYLISRGV